MKIYIASSWKISDVCLEIASLLRTKGFDVDCFCDESRGRFVFGLAGENGNRERNKYDAISFLSNPKAQKAFHEDKKWLDWADVCLLVLPSGRSAHLEAGYAVGQGKKLFIFGDFPKGEFDVMYGLADGLFSWRKIEELFEILDEIRRNQENS